MRLEVRRSGEMVHTCETCGATDLLSTHELPLAVDFSLVLEAEMLRREVGLARMFRDHQQQVAVEQARREYELMTATEQTVTDLMCEFDDITKKIPLDVSGWRLVRKRRERLFKERIDAAVAGLLDRTRYPLTGSSDKDRS